MTMTIYVYAAILWACVVTSSSADRLVGSNQSLSLNVLSAADLDREWEKFCEAPGQDCNMALSTSAVASLPRVNKHHGQSLR